MPQTPHVETHVTSSEKIRDIVIGMSDGSTAPGRAADVEAAEAGVHH